MWYPFILSGDEIEDGKAFRGGEGRSGARYSGKGRRLPEKRVYVSPNSHPHLKNQAGWFSRDVYPSGYLPAIYV
jgi:hypothetical protein